MKINHLHVLLPCHSLENLEIDRNAAEAEQLLAGWTALYHPTLIHAVHTMPKWLSAHMNSGEVSGSLVILPPCCETLLPDDWLDEAQKSEAAVLRNLTDRQAMIVAAMDLLDEKPPAVDPELVADFLALGYCHLMVELLTRKLRYMSNLDESGFRTSLVTAADAAVQGDGESARTHLQSAFDRLHDAREYFYPTEPRLLDLTLLASTTIGESLRTGLKTDLPQNLLLSGDVVEEMAARQPESLAVLKEALSKKTVGIIGGEYAEEPLPLLPPEAIAKNLESGLTAYEKHLGCRPKVFGRRKFGLTPALPQILEKFGFTAALHFTLDDGQFPTGNQSRVQWEGFDGSAIEALARVPLAADKADTFLSLPKRLGNSMELDHSPVQIFAHWPGKVSPWYEDLRRIAAYSRVLGYFCTIDDFFEQTQLAGQRVQYQIDQYRSPYLSQDATGNQDAISRWVRYYRRAGTADSMQTLNAISKTVGWVNRSVAPPINDVGSGGAALRLPHPTFSSDDQIDRQMQESLDNAALALAENLHGKSSRSENGYLLLNPSSFSQRQGVLLPELAGTPEISDAVRATADKAAVVDLPSMGFVWIGSGRDGETPSTNQPPLAGEHTLRNEFFEINFDPATGAIRAVLDYKSRHPRLAQQIGFRMPQGESDPTSDRHYSIMAADEFKIVSSSSVLGEMLCRGRLMDRNGERVAGFEQVTRVWRGSRVIEIEIELDPVRLPEEKPWNSYYACRFAWHDDSSSLFRSVNLANQPTEIAQLESPLFLDIRSGKQRTTILNAGLPYHRRIGPRKLDSLLIVSGESARKFRIGVGIDVPNPTTAALSFIQPPIKLFGPHQPPAASGWLFHLDHRNVIATSWLPLESPTEQSAVEDNLPQNGFRVRLLETEGRPAQLKLRCLKNVVSARKLETGDTPPAELNIEGDTVHIPMTPHQWIDVEVQFQS
jgi:alpha-mannosidase